MDFLDIRKIVAALLENTAFAGVYPVPITEITLGKGYDTTYFDPTAETKEISGAVSHSQKTVYLNAKDNARRQFFTAAHELGHIVLHAGDGDTVDYRSTMFAPNTKKEREANMFAEEVLLPKEEFIRRFKKYECSINFTADFFGVNPIVAEIRAKNLGLI